MSRFSQPLKKDLLDAQSVFSGEGKYDLAAVIGNLTNVAESMGKLIKSEMLTPAEELEYFRGHFLAHISWEDNSEDGLTPDEIALAQKLVEGLTATDHLQNLN
jgi:hypothetical protein